MQSYIAAKLVAPRRVIGGLGSHLGTSLHGVGFQEFLSDIFGITLIKPSLFQPRLEIIFKTKNGFSSNPCYILTICIFVHFL